MRIRRHLFFCNTVSVLVALVAMLAVNSAATHAIGRHYQRQAEEMFQAMRVNVATQEGMVWLDRGMGELELVGAVPFRPASASLGRPRPRMETMTLSLFLSGGAAIVVILLLNTLFTRYQLKKLLQPVNALTRAAGRVEAGDFTQAIDYRGRDEFAPVCAAFNRMQEHLLAEQEKNAAYEQARTDLVAGISHDLRTPLTSVKGYIKGLRDGVAQTPERQRQYLEVAYRRACDMDVLLQRLFYFSRLETGNLPLFLQPADLGAFIARFAAETAPELEQAGGRFETSLSPEPHPACIDAEQLYRVLSNLKDNALRYALEGSRVYLTLKTAEGTAEASVRSTSRTELPEGVDFTARFVRGDESRTDGGSGLGLSIADSFTRACGGELTVSTEADLFTAVVTFPIEQ